MTAVTTIDARFDYKYADADWRKDIAETFQKTKNVNTAYTCSDGHLVRTVATTTTFASAIARVAADPIKGPPYFYADKNFYADVAWIFQVTLIVTTDWEAFSVTSYKITIDTFDVLKNTHTVTTQIVDGNIPLAPTISSGLTSLVQRPLIGSLNAKCTWVDNTKPLDLPWAENPDDMAKAAKRQQQRDSAILREFTAPWNPLLKVGMTVFLVHPSRGIAAKHIVVGIKGTVDPVNARAKMDLQLEYWQP